MNFFWILAILAAGLFFWGSFTKTNIYLINFGYSSRSILEIALILLAVFMVILSFSDVRKRRIEYQKKKKLLKTLKKQRALLQKKFTVEASTLNFALFSEEKKTDIQEKIDNSKEDKNQTTKLEELPENKLAVAKKIINTQEPNSQFKSNSQIVEEEAFSDFSPQWQSFLQENEKKSSVEKMNKMLELN